MMEYLYIIAYKNDEDKMKEETIPADTIHFAFQCFNKIMQVKGIKKPKIKRITEYKKVVVIDYDEKVS